MLKIPGTIEALPIALNCSDFARVASQIHRPRVAPEPPAITNILENSPATMKRVPSDALLAIFARAIGLTKAKIMFAP